MTSLFSSSPFSLFRRHAHAPRVRAFELGRQPLRPRPIEPDCIEEGTPVASVVTVAESPDRLFSSGVWECTAGKFKVAFALDEMIHVLVGEVIVRGELDGVVHTLRPGDAAYFPMGLVTHWSVPSFVRKFFVVRAPRRSPIARARVRLGF